MEFLKQYSTYILYALGILWVGIKQYFDVQQLKERIAEVELVLNEQAKEHSSMALSLTKIEKDIEWIKEGIAELKKK